VQHYTFDRAAFSALQKLFKQRHLQMAPTFGGPADGTSSVLLNLQEWVVSGGCALHDSHNALKWALHQQFCNPDLMKGLYIVVESVRNSYGQLLSYLGNWLVRSLQFVPDENLPPIEDRTILWTALGLDPTLVEVLACQLRLQWKGGRLQVSANCLNLPDVMETLSSALLGVWHFKKFSDSRWVTVGCSCRTLVASFLTGLESLVAFIREAPASSDFHISGFARLCPDMKKFCAAASLASYVTDAFLSEMMDDPRLPMRLAFLKQCVLEEQQWLDGLPSQVWEPIAEVVGCAAPELRADTIAAGHISVAFLHARVFSEAEKHPWSLACGDIPANLEELANGPEPVERTARKIWRLLQLNFNRHDIQQGLELLLDCSWGTASAEQQHASATLVKKFHREIGTEGLLVRSLLHSMRHLLCQPTTEERHMERLGRQVAKLQAKQPQNIQGRQLYFRDVLGLAGEWSERGRQLPPQFAQTIMRKHGESWSRAPASVKASYEAQASVERSASQQSLSEDIRYAEAQVELARLRAEEQDGRRPPLMLSSCKLSPVGLDNLQTLAASDMFSAAKVQQLRAKAKVAPPPLPLLEQQQLEQAVVEEDKPPQPKPPWLVAVCRLRDHCSDIALAIPSSGGYVFFKFLYATQSPLSAYFALLEEQRQPADTVVITGDNWEQVAMSSHEHQFRIDFGRPTVWDELPPAPEAQLRVLTGLWHQGGNVLVSDAATIPFKDFLSGLPPLKEQKSRVAPARHTGRVGNPGDLVTTHPFLEHFLSETIGRAASSNSPGARPVDLDAPDEESQPLDDEALAAAFDELHKAREAWGPTEESLGDDFKVNLLGGAWSLQTKGKAVVACLASAKTARATNWCIQYGMHRSGRFEVSLYGEQAAQTFARAWAHRMQFFLDLYLASGESQYRYTQGDKDSYLEPTEFTALASTLKGKVLARAAQLRGTFPR
jgi:hypothetical protein